MNKKKVVSINGKKILPEVKKKVVVTYLPVIDSLTPTGRVVKKQLKPRNSVDKAEEALKEALVHEELGSNGQIEKFYVVVADEEKSETNKLILPE